MAMLNHLCKINDFKRMSTMCSKAKTPMQPVIVQGERAGGQLTSFRASPVHGRCVNRTRQCLHVQLYSACATTESKLLKSLRSFDDVISSRFCTIGQ